MLRKLKLGYLLVKTCFFHFFQISENSHHSQTNYIGCLYNDIQGKLIDSEKNSQNVFAAKKSKIFSSDPKVKHEKLLNKGKFKLPNFYVTVKGIFYLGSLGISIRLPKEPRLVS